VVGSAEVVQDDDRIFAKINLVRSKSLEFGICIKSHESSVVPRVVAIFPLQDRTLGREGAGADLVLTPTTQS